MLTLSFNFFAFVRVSFKEAVEKIQKLFSFAGWRKEQGRGGAIFDQTDREESNFFLESIQGERREKIFSLCPRQTFGR